MKILLKQSGELIMILDADEAELQLRLLSNVTSDIDEEVEYIQKIITLVQLRSGPPKGTLLN